MRRAKTASSAGAAWVRSTASWPAFPVQDPDRQHPQPPASLFAKLKNRDALPPATWICPHLRLCHLHRLHRRLPARSMRLELRSVHQNNGNRAKQRRSLSIWVPAEPERLEKWKDVGYEPVRCSDMVISAVRKLGGDSVTRFIALDDFDDLLVEYEQLPDENAKIAAYCETFLRGGSIEKYPADPFSASYRDKVLEIWGVIAQRSEYNPKDHEQSTYLVTSEKYYRPTIYQYNSSVFLSRYLSAFAAILRVVNVDSSHSILEYGAGDGQISITLARMGCSVSVIDVEQRYLSIIETQCRDLGLSIDTKQALFGENFDDNRCYDRILFFEAFHHGIDHQRVVAKLRDMLNPGGKVIFAGEPIIDPHGHWALAVPFPWGPRLDGLSARAMRMQGWCELGFQQPYFVEMLMRAGFQVELVPCAHEGLGTCYVATPLAEGRLELGCPILIETFEGQDAGWHSGEGAFRWTTGRATLPVPSGYSKARFQVCAALPAEKYVEFRAGKMVETRTLQPGETAMIEIALPADAGRVEIIVNAHIPAEHWGTADLRALGVQISHVQYA